MSERKKPTIARCSCGSVELEIIGAPIASVSCCCDDCQAAARQLEALPDAPPILDRYGGSELVLYRKDRVHVAKGADLLRDYKLKERSATNRAVASCCNSLMMLRFDRGPHWSSLLRPRLQGEVPPLQMRIQMKFSSASSEESSDVPGYATFPPTLVLKLVMARVAMLLGR